MAGAYVQAQKVDTSGTSGGIVITLTAGNNVYVWVRAGGTVTPSVADTLGNTYNPVARDGSNNWPLAPDVDTDTVGVYEALNVTGGSTTITVSTVSSVTQRHIATEFSGLTTATAVDKAAFTDSQATTTPTSGATASRTQASEMLMGCISSSGTSPVFTAGSGFTKALAETTKSAVEWQVVSVTGTDAGTWTMGTPDPGGAGNCTIAAITTLKASSATTDGRSASIPARPGGFGPRMRRALPQQYADTPATVVELTQSPAAPIPAIGPRRRRSIPQKYADTPVTPTEFTQSPAAPFRPGRGPGMGPMSLHRNFARPSLPDANVSPDVTVALTGVQGTGAVGTLGVQIDLALTGNSATGAVGTLTPGTSLALTGVSGTGSVGTLAPDTSVAMTGVSGTGSVGTLAPTNTVTLSGNEATATVGDLAASVDGDVTIALTGVSATASVGDLSASVTDEETPRPAGGYAGGKFKGRIKYWWEKLDKEEFEMPYRAPKVTNPVEPFRASLELERTRQRKRKKLISIAAIVAALLDEEDL